MSNNEISNKENTKSVRNFQSDPKALLPHRDPFLFLTKITELIPIKSAKGYWDVENDFYVFKGHFPNYPVLPGVLILESMAQLGACALYSHPDYKDKLALFGGVDKARFRRQVKPGDRLFLEVEIIQLARIAGKAMARAYINDNLACNAELMFVIAQ